MQTTSINLDLDNASLSLYKFEASEINDYIANLKDTNHHHHSKLT